MLDFVSNAFEMDATLFVVTEDLRLAMFIAMVDLHLLPFNVGGGSSGVSHWHIWHRTNPSGFT